MAAVCVASLPPGLAPVSRRDDRPRREVTAGSQASRAESPYAANILVFLEQAWIGPASHLWTLAVEEQFYVFWPLAAVLFTRNFERFAVAFVVCSISTRLVLAVFFPDIGKGAVRRTARTSGRWRRARGMTR